MRGKIFFFLFIPSICSFVCICLACLSFPVCFGAFLFLQWTIHFCFLCMWVCGCVCGCVGVGVGNVCAVPPIGLPSICTPILSHPHPHPVSFSPNDPSLLVLMALPPLSTRPVVCYFLESAAVWGLCGACAHAPPCCLHFEGLKRSPGPFLLIFSHVHRLPPYSHPCLSTFFATLLTMLE